MKLSKLGMRMERINPDELLSENILMQSGMNHFFTLVKTNVENIIRKKLNIYECVEVNLPINQFRLTTDIATITGTVAADFAKSNLKLGKNNLPVTIYQIGTNNLATMMNAYSFHACGEDLRSRYYKMRRCFEKIFDELGLDFWTVEISKDDFGDTTYEKFMVVSDNGKDTILVNEEKGIALCTDEIHEDQKGFEKKKGIEIGHIYRPGQTFSKSVRATFKSVANDDIPYFMGCYHINVSKVFEVLCENSADKKGFSFQSNVAGYTFMIAYPEEYEDEAFDLYGYLKEDHGCRVVIDDRKLDMDTKIEEWELLGIPYLIILNEECHDDIYYVYLRSRGYMCELRSDMILNLPKYYD